MLSLAATQPRIAPCPRVALKRKLRQHMPVCMAGPGGDSKVVREFREDDSSISVPKDNKKDKALYADQVPV